MSPLFRIGQALKGKVGTYTITKHIQNIVWFAKKCGTHETVVIKGVDDHPRVESERNILKALQPRTPFLRPLVDEIEDPATPVTIALRHLDSELLTETRKRALNRKELKHVCKSVLEALRVLHEENLVHTDVKLDNIFANIQEDADNRFSEVQLGDLGSCDYADSERAKSGTMISAPMWASPEAHLELPWNTASDIWQVGTVMISMIYGGDFQIFSPSDLSRDDELYYVSIVVAQYRYFGPFPEKFKEIANEDVLRVISWIEEQVPADKMSPITCADDKDISKKDKAFIGKMMKLDCRDRPTAKELLEDEWWADEE